jgi:hypothetical protein
MNCATHFKVKRALSLAVCAAITACNARVAPSPRTIATSTAGAAAPARADVLERDATSPASPAAPGCRALLALLRDRDGSITTVAADRSPPVVAACAALEREAQQALSALQRRARGVELSELGAFGRCESAGRGAWFIAPVRTQAEYVRRYTDRRERAWEVHVDWRVDYVDAAGQRHAGAVVLETYHTDPSDAHASIVLQNDGDGDGVGEIIVGLRSTNFEGGDHFGAVQVAWVNGSAVRDPRVAGIEVNDPVDPDADGRVDFVQRSRIVSRSMTTDGLREEYGPATLAHRLSDGTFSRDDAVAQAFALSQCFDEGERLSLSGGSDRTVLRAACDRMLGLTGAALTASFAQLEADGSSLPSQAALDLLAQEPPPVPLIRCRP